MKHKENYNGFKKVAKFIANVISWTILIILVLIAAFLLYYFVANKIYASKGERFAPAVGLYTIVSPSMTPNLNIYDVIVDVKVDKPEDIHVGDIITFISTSTISKGLTVTHRVVAILETENGIEYRTQGDNNQTPDTASVAFQNVLGKVFIKIPQLGRVQRFISNSAGWLLVVVLPALFIIISDIVKIIKLSTAKKKVNYALDSEKQKEKKENKQKEEIKKELKRRYNLDRQENEPDPIETKHELKKMSVNKKKETTENNLFSLPKLKNNENKKKQNKGKRRK